MSNTEYFFLPFKFEDQMKFDSLVKAFGASESWVKTDDEIKYMLKYVADKINSRDPKNCRCFHYLLKSSARSARGISSENEWYAFTGKMDGQDEVFRFQIIDVHLYCFSTSVGIISFRVHLEKEDPLWVSTALYYLKKVSRIKFAVDGSDSSPETMLNISERLMKEFEHISSFEFFYYANASTERANVFTYLQTGSGEDCRYQLYYLRRCYSQSFLYTENEKLDEKEIYQSSPDIVWGISAEAAVCLTCPEPGREKFICGTFYKNFNIQYLFMYVLLLHQKYVLYLFLMKIGIGTYNNLEMLEEYRDQLYEFETDFVFTCITEVPQYQTVYDKMMTAFSLKRMYEDVHEPLISLGEVRRAVSEDHQKRQENDVNKALLLLSVLSFFSALVDSFDFTESFFSWFFAPDIVKILQFIWVAGIVAVVAVAFKNLWNSKRRK